MTHGAVYGAANKARCVIHIHSPFLFTSLLAKGFPGLRNPSPTEPLPFPMKWHA